MLRFSRLSRYSLLAIVGVVLLFIYAPLMVLIMNAFNEAQISAWPIQDFSTKWWVVAWGSGMVQRAWVVQDRGNNDNAASMA